ncbi:hypothetical protein GQX73_g6166 [Xylaria multiplex]|uniref:Uncharacterized protein n=1 Tax=Xylaria multiplex TaxID=323545 RepID=A0A7C8MR29_9PEZI|nr:hypothetical protein GQX73_g6166 [Xylaria multiplex]
MNDHDENKSLQDDRENAGQEPQLQTPTPLTPDSSDENEAEVQTANNSHKRKLDAVETATTSQGSIENRTMRGILRRSLIEDSILSNDGRPKEVKNTNSLQREKAQIKVIGDGTAAIVPGRACRTFLIHLVLVVDISETPIATSGLYVEVAGRWEDAYIYMIG